jgi:hypothetical protein
MTKTIEPKPHLNSAQIVEFIKIVKVLNNYYNNMYKYTSDPKTASHVFRENLVSASLDEIKFIHIENIDKFTYKICVEMVNGNSQEWIHVDGIAEERIELRKRNIESHPVFSITCLEDIVNNKI